MNELASPQIINPWSGRFDKNMAEHFVSFNTSLPIEERLFESDIKASIAHAEMLNKVDLLTTEEKLQIVNALSGILDEWRNDKIILRPELEDIHMNIETLLIERIGDTGKKIHTARSRNDQQAVAQRLFFKQSTQELISAIKKLEEVLLKRCTEFKSAIMPTYTHLQRAEFTTFSHWLSTYIVMLDRDKQRLQDCLQRADECPLGACASSGTSLPIDRLFVSDYLGFKKPTLNSIDAVSDRDYLIEFVSHASLLMMHLSRLSEEIIIFNSKEFGFIELDDSYCTGSSIMPQKKNPDVLELIRGKSATVLGNSVSLLSLVKSLALGYNKDTQEDKYSWFSALDNSISSVVIITELLDTLKVNTSMMYRACKGGHIIATEFANYLVRKGMPFREAHRVIGNLVKLAEIKNIDLSDLTYSDLLKGSELFQEDIMKYSIEDWLSHKNSMGSSGEEALEALLKNLEMIVYE